MQSTRQEILEILKEDKQATVEDLAERLQLTPMTIRHHLNVLQAQNLVTTATVRRSQKVGRPRLVYTLTAAADDLFPQTLWRAGTTSGTRSQGDDGSGGDGRCVSSDSGPDSLWRPPRATRASPSKSAWTKCRNSWSRWGYSSTGKRPMRATS